MDAQETLAALWDESLTLLKPFTPKRQEIPEGLGLAESLNGRTHLEAARWILSGYGELRLVRIVGQRLLILNGWIFPSSPTQLPLFAAEILVFGNQPRLAFVDLQDVGLEPSRQVQVKERTGQIARRFQFLANHEPPPNWATNYSLGGFMFSRVRAPSIAYELYSAYTQYLRLWQELALQITPPTEPVNFTELRNYQKYHAANSPGQTYLQQTFGREWTTRFVSDFLFAPLASAIDQTA